MRPTALAALTIAGLMVLPSALGFALQPRLDLSPAPQPPAPGQGAGVIALAEDLLNQARNLGAQTDPRSRAMAAARRFTRELLITGEQLGPFGSQRILIARTVARNLDGIDRAIRAASNPEEEASLTLIAADLDAAIPALAPPEADPWRITRDAFALLTQTVAERARITAPPWPASPDAPARGGGALTGELEAWSRLPGVSAPAIEALRDLDRILTDARGWASYEPAAARTRRTIRSAASAFAADQAWLPEAAQRAMGEQFSAASLDLSSPDQRDSALVMLRRLARYGDLIARTGRLDDNPGTRRIRSALAEAASAHAPDLLIEARLLDGFERVLELALARASLADEKTLIRQARPAWRSLVPIARQSEPRLVAALPEILTRLDATSDPGIASAIATHYRAIQDLRDIELLSRTMSAAPADALAPATAEPEAAPRWKRVADRILKLGQDIPKNDARDAALASLRGMADQIRRFSSLPGEEALRESIRAAQSGRPAGAWAWSTITGGREQALLSEIGDRRGGWLDGWDRAGYAGAGGEVQRLQALLDLMAVLSDAAGVAGSAAEGPVAAALNAWPGWELSPDALAAITGDLITQTGEATKAITDGDATRTSELAATIRQSHAAALLAGRLAREARAAGYTAPAAADGGALLEVARGGPDPDASWMARWTDDLATICRYAEEAAAARKLGNRERADALLRYVNARAATVLDQLPEPRTRGSEP